MTLDALLSGASPAVDAQVAVMAGRLRAGGVGRGDAVCFLAPSTPETVAVYRACWRVGAAAVPIHHRAGRADVERIVAAVAPAAGPDLDLPDGAPVEHDHAEPDDIAVVLFTSGSSGAAKGVRHTHAALASKAEAMVAVHGLTSHDVVLMPAPLAHVSGLLNGILVPGAAGMRTVLMARWDPDDALELIERERVSFMVGPPTFFLDLLASPSFAPERVASLRLISSGGAGVSPAFVDRASASLGCVVKRTYGSTEAPTVTTSHVGDDPAKARATDGRAVGDVELRVDASRGELELRGPGLFVGYTDPAATAAAFTPDGWFRTGDLAAIDGEGWLTILGRIDDVIIRGGENVAAAELESVLEAHPGIEAAIVVGYPDARLGERIAAFVVAPNGFDLATCAAWCKERGVARYKFPERLIVLDALPVLASGKADRSRLRAAQMQSEQAP
ncbi:MAG: class I adenylate-forming enzyme family protein [Acidimicrobiales bacterium]